MHTFERVSVHSPAVISLVLVLVLTCGITWAEDPAPHELRSADAVVDGAKAPPWEHLGDSALPLPVPVSHREIPRFRRSERVLANGVTTDVRLEENASQPALVGFLSVRRDDGQRFVFTIKRYTLILISYQGRLWAGQLKHLAPGWKVSVAYDIPPNDDWNVPDKNSDIIEKWAENLIAEVPPKP